MSAACEIRFENHPDKVVYAGQQVNGVVDIIITELLKVRKLILFVLGEAECNFQERTSRGGGRRRRHRRTNYTYFKGHALYLNTTIDLIPVETEIVEGQHTYNFSFLIPPGTPSSTNENKGHVRYMMRVLFHRPWKTDLEFKNFFTVIKPSDLNADPQMRIPLERKVLKQLCSFLCTTQKLTFEVFIPQMGFVAGQKIPLIVTMNNPTTVEVRGVEIQMKKHIVYTSSTPYIMSKHEEAEIYFVRHGTPFTRNKKVYNIEVTIPYVVPSSRNEFTSVLTISYMIYIKAKISGFHSSPVISFPIVIGTMPIIPQEDHSNIPVMLDTHAVSPSAPLISDNSDLPTFEEVMKEKEEKSSGKTYGFVMTTEN